MQDAALTRYLEIAKAHWSGAPEPVCQSPAGPVPVHAVLYDDPDPGVSARAEEPGCRIWLDRDFWPRPLDQIDCTIIAHEWGHLVGLPHTGNPNALMYDTPTSGAPGCALIEAQRAGRAGAKAKSRTTRPTVRRSPHIKHARKKAKRNRAGKRRCSTRTRRTREGKRRMRPRAGKRVRCKRRARRISRN